MTKELAFIAWILVAVLLTLSLTSLLGALVLTGRRAAIRRPGGAVDCSMRWDTDPRWRRGVIAYRTGQLMWFRSLRPGLRPDAVFDRRALRLVERRPHDQHIVLVRFDTGSHAESLWLRLSPDALTGLLAWVEAAPYGWQGGSALDRHLALAARLP